MTYPNLRGEMAKRGMTPFSLCKKIGIAYATMTAKMNGSREWKWSEILALKKAIGTDMPIEILFSDKIVED